jgi:MoaA/NifB/PqqE/SkfB family radical SAM enzyme
VTRPDEMSLEEIVSFIKSSARYRPGFFLTGGEPFVRGDVFDIIDVIKRHSLPVGVVTSGTNLNEKKIDRLKKLDLDVAIISFHGTREVHDSVVGMEGAYDRAMESLRLFAEKFPGRPPMINFIVSERSVPVLRDFLDEALQMDNIIIRLSHLNFLTAREIEDQKKYWEERFPSVPLDILSYSYDCDTSKFLELQKILADPKYETVFTKPILSDNDFANWYSNDFTLGTRCVFIWRSTFLNANGDVYPCQFLYIRMGNVREEKMEAIWNNDLYQRFRETLKDVLMPGCSRCCKI